jgi:hypothetical protein
MFSICRHINKPSAVFRQSVSLRVELEFEFGTFPSHFCRDCGECYSSADVSLPLLTAFSWCLVSDKVMSLTAVS